MEALNARINEEEERISDIEDKMMENKEAEKKRQTTTGSWGENSREKWYHKVKQYRIIRIPEEEERERGAEDILEQMIAENFPNLGKDTGIQVQEAQRTPRKINKNRSTP